MEQKPLGDSSGGIQKQPEIILSPAGGSTPPASNKVCPNCGTIFPSDSVYCQKCGIKLPDITPQGQKICSGCHTPNFPSAQYCYKCGLPLPEKLSSGYENQIQYAGFWIRFAAYLIDGILLNIVTSIISTAIVFSNFSFSDYMDLLSNLESTGTIDQAFWSFLGKMFLAYLVGLAVMIAYYTFTVGKWGRTVGKATLRLKVVKPDGSRVSYWRALGRSLAYYLNGFTFGLSYLMIAFTNKKRGLHDYIADTIVIKTG